MALLYWFASIRTPLMDQVMALVTHLGEETLFLAAALLMFWCVDKYRGYYLLSVGLTGTLLNQWMKIACRIPRPWVRDPGFTIVESARAAATGYSFPSGHTTSVFSWMGCIARWTRRRWLRVLLMVLAALTGISRMYLGVHTPWDVGVGMVTALALVFLMYPVAEWSEKDPKRMNRVFLAMTALAAGFVAYVELWRFPADVDPANLGSAVKNAYTLFGTLAGGWLMYTVDRKWINFPTAAPLWGQTVKVTGGLILVLAVKSLLKAPLLGLFGGHEIAHAVRYFLVVVTAGCLWPMTFRWFAGFSPKERE